MFYCPFSDRITYKNTTGDLTETIISGSTLDCVSTNKTLTSQYSKRRIVKAVTNNIDPQISSHVITPPFLTQSPIRLSSRLFHEVLSIDDILGIRTELKILLLSEFDSTQGIPVEANQPLGCREPLINLKRPAVLRVYFGKSKKCTDSLNIVRPTYGPISSSSSVGMDPNNFTTKAMSLHLHSIGQTLLSMLRSKFSPQNCPPLEEEFNHCTVLIYSGKNNNGISNSTLSYHSDCTYDHNGTFIKSRNSQKENTCVAVLTVGDSRKLYVRKRVVVDGSLGRKKWRLTDDNCVSFMLEDNSVFLLHPDDERPTLRSGDNYISQYVHGGVNIENDNDLSIAFVFRVVCIEREYDAISSKLLPNDSDLKQGDCVSSDMNTLLRNYLESFRLQELYSYTINFQTFVKGKFMDWKWY